MGKDEKKMDLVSCFKSKPVFCSYFFLCISHPLSFITFFFVFEWHMNSKYLGMPWSSVGALKKHTVTALRTEGIIFHSNYFIAAIRWFLFAPCFKIQAKKL